jgi:hypothetical protein
MLTRQQIYTLLIVISAGLMLGRIIAVNRTDSLLIQKNRMEQIPKQLADKEARLRAVEPPIAEEDMQAELEKTRAKLLVDATFELPFFSANDRSRWTTIRALVEPDMRVQRTVKLPDGSETNETVWYAIDKVQNIRGWDTIDMVKHDIVKPEMQVLQVQQTLVPPIEGLGEKEIEEKTEKKIVWSADHLDQWIDGWGAIETDIGTEMISVKPEMCVEQTTILPNGKVRTDTVWYVRAPDVEKVSPIQVLTGRTQEITAKVKKIISGQHDEPEVVDLSALKNKTGVGYLYSSKPPLLPTLMAAPYALMYWVSGGKLSLEKEPFLIVRITLILCNVLPLALCWFLLARLIERFGTTNWGRVFSVAFICFGTFISTFAVTINNHIPGVVSVTIAFYCVVRIVYDKEIRWWYFAVAGFFGAFAVACEMPALLFLCLIGFWIFCHRPLRTLFLFIPAALLVAGAFFATNYIAHKTVVPAYGKKYVEGSWYLYDYERGGRIVSSHWNNPKDLDKGEKSIPNYIFHCTVGHHGLFSLTPVFVLSFLGLLFWLFSRQHWCTASIILVTSVVVFAFYMLQPLNERNYGGNTSALRWMFWFAPLWSVTLVAAADKFSHHVFLRMIALTCLIVSAMSVAYPVWNPWTMPWTYNLLEYVG